MAGSYESTERATKNVLRRACLDPARLSAAPKPRPKTTAVGAFFAHHAGTPFDDSAIAHAYCPRSRTMPDRRSLTGGPAVLSIPAPRKPRKEKSLASTTARPQSVRAGGPRGLASLRVARCGLCLAGVAALATVEQEAPSPAVLSSLRSSVKCAHKYIQGIVNVKRNFGATGAPKPSVAGDPIRPPRRPGEVR